MSLDASLPSGSSVQTGAQGSSGGFTGFSATLNSIVAQATHPMVLQTSDANSITITANTAGTFAGGTSSQIQLTASRAINIEGDLLPDFNQAYTLGNVNFQWETLSVHNNITGYATPAVSGSAFFTVNATGYILNSSGAQFLRKTGNNLFVETNTANDIAFRVNSTEVMRCVQATNTIQVLSNLQSSIGNPLVLTAAATQPLTLTGASASTWSTSGGGLTVGTTDANSVTLRANTAGTLGTSSTQIILGAVATVLVDGSVNPNADLVYGLGSSTNRWQNIRAGNQIGIDNGSGYTNVISANNITLSSAATSQITKSNGALFVQTSTAHDLVFRTTGAECYRIDNATNAIKFASNLTAPGAVAITINNAPAGTTAVQEYVKVLGTGGATRYIALIG